MSTDSCWKPFWKTPVRKALKDENNFSKAIPDRLRIPSHNKRNLEGQGKRIWGRSKRQVDQTRLYLKPTFSYLGNPTVLATKAACGHPIIKKWKKKYCNWFSCNSWWWFGPTLLSYILVYTFRVWTIQKTWQYNMYEVQPCIQWMWILSS